jgi:hypothetical protein
LLITRGSSPVHYVTFGMSIEPATNMNSLDMVEARFPCKQTVLFSFSEVFRDPLTFSFLLDPFKVTTNEIVANAKGVYDQVIL